MSMRHATMYTYDTVLGLVPGTRHPRSPHYKQTNTRCFTQSPPPSRLPVLPSGVSAWQSVAGTVRVERKRTTCTIKEGRVRDGGFISDNSGRRSHGAKDDIRGDEIAHL